MRFPRQPNLQDLRLCLWNSSNRPTYQIGNGNGGWTMVNRQRRRLGEILLQAGLLTAEQLEEALLEQGHRRERLGKILVDKNFVTENQMLEVLAQQLGILTVQLNPSMIDPEVATAIPAYLAQRHAVIPLRRKGNRIVVAMADPLNILAIDDVSLLTGSEVEPVIARESVIRQTIDQIFGLKESADAVLQLDDAEKDAIDQEKLAAMVDDAPIVKVVNSIIQQAVSEGASDIHLEPREGGLQVRLRVDGFLRDLMLSPKKTQALITSRVKIISGMNIAERRLPQDGRFSLQMEGRPINIRVSSLPTVQGEKVVLRVLDKAKMLLPVENLGFSPQNEAVFRSSLRAAYGMILVTGPTGSGKTTTLYSSLNAIATPEKNAVAVEDPVEFRLDGINQVQVNAKIGLSFAAALRSILRQDPDIIMVGEIRDAETAEIAIRAALTGHLVFSTLHTNDAPRALSRLAEMGIEPFLIASSVVCVVAQRLLRKICLSCKVAYTPTPQEMSIYNHYGTSQARPVFYRGNGCRECKETGYSGRTAIHEVLALTSELRSLVASDSPIEDIRQAALRAGMVTLQEEGMRLVSEGVTSISEVIRVVFEGV
jgi:type IV pilus assembly protein PilB